MKEKREPPLVAPLLRKDFLHQIGQFKIQYPVDALEKRFRFGQGISTISKHGRLIAASELLGAALFKGDEWKTFLVKYDGQPTSSSVFACSIRYEDESRRITSSLLTMNTQMRALYHTNKVFVKLVFDDRYLDNSNILNSIFYYGLELLAQFVQFDVDISHIREKVISMYVSTPSMMSGVRSSKEEITNWLGLLNYYGDQLMETVRFSKLKKVLIPWHSLDDDESIYTNLSEVYFGGVLYAFELPKLLQAGFSPAEVEAVKPHAQIWADYLEHKGKTTSALHIPSHVQERR